MASLHVAYDIFEISEQENTVVAELPSKELLSICRELEVFGEVIELNKEKVKLRFSVNGFLLLQIQLYWMHGEWQMGSCEERYRYIKSCTKDIL